MSFHNQMQKFFAFFILFGMWSSWQNFKYKKLLRAHSVFSIAIACFSFCSTFLFKPFHAFNTFPHTVSNLLFMSVLFTHLIIVLESGTQSVAQSELVERFTFVDRLFEMKLQVRIPYEKEKRKVFIWMLVIASVEVIIKLCCVIYLIFWSKVYQYDYFILYSNMLICLRMIQVFFLIYLIENRLNLINKELREIQRMHTQTGSAHNKVIQILDNSYNRILSLKQIYDELYGICNQISIIFGRSLLTIVSHIFFYTTFEWYWAYRNLSNPANMIICLGFAGTNLVILGALAFFCTSCSQQVSF